MRNIFYLSFLKAVFNDFHELRIHIGAHKTATTHLQDTLQLVISDLLDHNIHFIPLDLIRERLFSLRRTRWDESIKYNILKIPYIKSKLFADCRSGSAVVFSEENILGGPLEVCSTRPYPNIYKNLDFVRILSTHIPTKVFLSIRSFDRVLPGSFITGLRFTPEKAIQTKKYLLNDLSNNRLPSWADVVSDLLVALPNVSLKIWAQEDYKSYSDRIICEFIGRQISTLPDIPPPSRTMTPSVKAINQIEKLLRNPHFMRPDNWTQICDQIYSSEPISPSNPRYTFLSEENVIALKNQYTEDLKNINERWPGILIKYT
jgi:hypothetical protein